MAAAVYKKVGEHGIRADVLIPKEVPSGKRPVIARFHGGSLIYADWLSPPEWFPPWLLELAERHGAVIVSANYRLLPEATGVEILSDIDDFWSWLHSDEPRELLINSSIELDLNKILTAGESAGGLLSLYLALSHPDEIRAATVAYPMINLDPPSLYPPSRSQLLPYVPGSVITEHLMTVKPGHVESSAPSPHRDKLAAACFQHEKVFDFYTREAEKSPYHHDRLFQLHRLDSPGQKLPRGGIAIIHGEDDDMVVVESSRRFVNKAREVMKDRQGGNNVVLSVQPGGHGFDGTASLNDQ
ncbi:hypothetical protein VTN77DRAFT_4954 [Rasamsonia byssochlamydoides]|uniref:uncharacterized protein n=1 Tax=Rasamsonia byssochlamydoides TaxID=89139 RepID=UPI003742EC1D